MSQQFPGQPPQFPQGGPQLPPQQFPQGAGQFPPPQQFPQGGQLPPQGQPPQGQPLQAGQPAQQPYPAAGPQSAQPQYPPAGQQAPQQFPPAGQQYPGGGQPYPPQQQFPPGGHYPGGAPAKAKSQGLVIGIVLAALAVVALGGWLLMSVFGPRDPGPAPTPTPSPVQTTAQPTPTATPTTEPSATASPSTAPSTPSTPGGSLEVGLGVTVRPADGWRQANRDELKNYTELTNGDALLVTQAFRVEGQVTGRQIVTAYQDQITGNMTGVSKKEAADLDVKNERLSAGIASWSGTRATSQGSVKLSYLAIISVRDDGLAVMSTLIVPSGVTLASQQTDYLAMTNSLLSSQLQA